MFCQRCGIPADPRSRFCERCGYPLATEAPKRLRWPWISGLVTAAVSLAAVMTLIFLTGMPGPAAGTDIASGENPFNAQILPGFTFDENAAEVYGGEPLPTPSVDGMTPAAGTAGETIRISGSNLAGSVLTAAKLGEAELNIASISDSLIVASVPYGAASGELALDFAYTTLSAGYFEVTSQDKQVVFETAVQPSGEPERFDAGDFAVTIPGNVLQSAQTLVIERAGPVHPVNLPETASSTAFSVTLGDMHQFNDLLTIEYILPADLPGAPSAAYFNTETSLWDTLPSEINGDRLYIYTDHLTDFVIFYWGEAIYSPDGYFKIYYKKDDTHTYAASMDELARMTGEALEEARKDYEAKIPASYRENFRYLGLFDSMDVYLDSGYTHGTYNAMTNNILLPTDYPDANDFEIVLAHEFFHSYQDAVWSEVSLVGKMGAGVNRWAVEALAECAAYELAFPEKGRQRLVSDGVTSQESYDLFNEVHEYCMACYLDYLLKKTGSTFDELWLYVAKSNSYLVETSLNDFFKSKSGDFISLAYSFPEFWLAVAGDADAPMQQALSAEFYGRQVYLTPDKHSAVFTYQTASAPTLAFGFFAVRGFSENMPLRIFDVALPDVSENGCWSAQVTGTDKPGGVNGARTAGGYAWERLFTGGSTADAHELYAFKQGEPSAVILALDSEIAAAPAAVTVSEIQAQCSPKKLDSAAVGQEYEFAFAFKDIFSHVSETRVEVDFGDGAVLVYKQENSGQLGGTVRHTFDSTDSTAVTCSLYDVSRSDKILISKLVIPVAVDYAVTLTANPKAALTGEPIRFTANIPDAGYVFKWDFGDGSAAEGSSQTEHAYSTAGTFAATVTVTDASGKSCGTAAVSVTVNEPETTQNVVPTAPTPSDEPSASETGAGSGPLNLQISGTWRAVYFFYKYDDEHYYCNTLQFNVDGTFESYLSAVKIEDYETTNHAYDVYHIESEIALSPNMEYVFARYVSEFGYTSGTYTYDAGTNYGEVTYTAQYKDADGNMREFTDTQWITFNLVSFYKSGITDPEAFPLDYKNEQYVNVEWTQQPVASTPICTGYGSRCQVSDVDVAGRFLGSEKD